MLMLLFSRVTEGQDDVGVANVSEEIKAEPADPVELCRGGRSTIIVDIS